MAKTYFPCRSEEAITGVCVQKRETVGTGNHPSFAQTKPDTREADSDVTGTRHGPHTQLLRVNIFVKVQSEDRSCTVRRPTTEEQAGWKGGRGRVTWDESVRDLPATLVIFQTVPPNSILSKKEEGCCEFALIFRGARAGK